MSDRRNRPNNYLAVRVQLVEVTKGMFGMLAKDKQIASISYIPDFKSQARNEFKRIEKEIHKKGKVFKV